MGRSSRRNRGPESAEPASQDARFGLNAKSNGEPLKSSEEGRIASGKKTLTAVWTIKLIKSRARI